MPRLFIAIDLPDDRRNGLLDLHDDELPARWNPPDQYHLTLRFLGDVDDAETGRLQEQLSLIDHPPFSIEGQGLNVFPSIRKPRVLVARIDEAPGLVALYGLVSSVASDLGFDPQRKPFNPHVTVARLKNATPRAVRSYLKEHSGFEIEPFRVDEFFLYASRLTPDGALHDVLQRYPLRTAPTADE